MSVIERRFVLYYPGTFVGSRFGLRTATSNLPDEFRPRTLVRVALHALMNRFCGAQTVAKGLGMPMGGGGARQDGSSGTDSDWKRTKGRKGEKKNRRVLGALGQTEESVSLGDYPEGSSLGNGGIRQPRLSRPTSEAEFVLASGGPQ
ncbi:hypothetical protein PCH_Pc21g19900 [Penicillium rubens Wisconsin 54-1255]|uniref:Uncharacterized protein n=1 Tax=Penicillium rubens (strain ATCC 28089 / DSM 1075 / NRRL 1951 / Wisconsin 54-1255) TaxID=500485 RepID=B6HJY8_PENRW|nr:hypothetical protein PCH_Pc21g19900 [Penicillium rubens Wisconsin 54-1255]